MAKSYRQFTHGIPWAITCGNRDEDSNEDAGTGVYERHMVDFVRQYKHNLNPEAPDREYGHSDAQLLVGSSRHGNRAAFAIWLLDSGNYLPGHGLRSIRVARRHVAAEHLAGARVFELNENSERVYESHPRGDEPQEAASG